MAKFCLVWFTPSPHGTVCACTEMFCLVAFLLFVFKYVCLYSWRNYICSLGLDPWRLSCMPLLFNPSSLVLAMRAEKKHLPRASLGQNGWKAACLERKKADESFCWRPGGWCRVGRGGEKGPQPPHSSVIAVSLPGQTLCCRTKQDGLKEIRCLVAVLLPGALPISRNPIFL